MQFVSHSVEETQELARRMAHVAQPGDVILLVGDLGAGKTHFTQGFAAGLSTSDVPTSPTFNLVCEYRGGRLPLYHFDLYRVESEDELQELGLDEYFASDAVTVIEWNKPGVALPGKTVKIDICDKGGEERLITVEGL